MYNKSFVVAYEFIGERWLSIGHELEELYYSPVAWNLWGLFLLYHIYSVGSFCNKKEYHIKPALAYDLYI